MKAGGIWASSGNLSAVIESTEISGNESIFNGGGLYYLGHELTVRSTTIRDNVTSVSAPNAQPGDLPVGGGGVWATSVPGGSITIEESTIIDMNRSTGFNSLGAGAILISDDSSLTITETTVSNNDALALEANVGGINIFAKNSSNVLVDDMKVIGNHADDDIGGLLIWNTDSNVTVSNTTISGNEANHNHDFDAAGGVWIRAEDGAQTTIQYSTISGNRIITPPDGGNQDVDGAGLFIQSASGTTTTILNTTISGNEAEGDGGGIKIGEEVSQGGLVEIRHSTITNNRADSDNDSVGTGGGIHIGNSTVTVAIEHTIIAGNFRGSGSTRDDVVGTISAAWSLIGDDTGATITGNDNQIGTSTTPIDPGLLPLAYNGGPTMTHALQEVSEARDAGDPLAVPGTNVPEFDQRGAGFSRLAGTRIDIGAFESEEPSECDICVTTTIDELENNALISLREAVSLANLAGVPTTICLPAGVYELTLLGTGGVSQGDLDVTGNVTIVGDGPGLSVIKGITTGSRIFDVANAGVLNISGVTLAVAHGTSNSDQRDGGAIRVKNGGQLDMSFSAVVGNETGGWGLGGGIYFAATASGSIESSVITLNYADQDTGGLYLQAASSGTGGTVTIESTIVANNWDGEESAYPDIYVGANRTLDSQGSNRFTTNPDGPGVFASGVGDYVKPPEATVDYVVTSIADTYDGSTDPVNMSLRDAIHQANSTTGAQEIWLPAWAFVLTRDRVTYGGPTDTSVAYGDLDIGRRLISDLGGSLTIRGVNGATSVGWAMGLPNDKVFELLGDYSVDGVPNFEPSDVDAGDGVVLAKGVIAADGDDDGDFVDDEDDEDIHTWNYGTQLMLYGIS
jgi:hypothetical protein